MFRDDTSPSPARAAHHDVLADVAPGLFVGTTVSRLAAEFAPLHPPIVRRVVLDSRRDLAGAPAPALPELVERLARQRLLESLSTPGRRLP
jgi:hypothetical protein